MNAMVWQKLLRRNSATTELTAIGLEISLSSLNMVQLQKNCNGAISIYDWACVPFEQDRKEFIYDAKEFKQLLKQAKTLAKFSGRSANAMLPASELKIISVTYATKKGVSTEAAIAEVVSERVDGPLSDYVIDFLPVRQSNESNRGLAVVAIAKQEIVHQYLDVLSSAGLKVNALDIGPAAVKRLVSALHKPTAGETVLVINFGAELSYLSILSGRRLLFDEEIKFGEQLLVDEVSKALDMHEDMAREQIQHCGLGLNNEFEGSENSAVEKEVAETLLQILKPNFNVLADSLKRALVYAVAETRGEPISQVYILGSVARFRGAASLLERLIDLPVKVLPDPLSQFGCAEDLQRSSQGIGHPELALATGLALRDLNVHG